jgi:hypothetical protein
MIERRFQVFISSTFRDLTAERQSVLLAIQKLNHIPAGMELFPSANDAPWEVIERIIAATDYYVLIIGGRYGSTDADGISFTEREYDLAVAKKIPVLAFLHADPGKLPAELCEMESEAKSRLDAFRNKVEAAHHCTFWRTAAELAGQVVISLVNEIAQNPKPGWVRGDFADEQQKLLSTIEMVRQENDLLRAQIEELKSTNFEVDGTKSICQGNDAVNLKLHRRVEVDKTSHVETDEISTTWHDVFMSLAWEATSGATADELMRIIAKTFGERYYMEDETWKQIATQFVALDLLAVRQEMRPASSMYHALSHSVLLSRESQPADTPTDIWHLTERGRRLFAQASAIKRDQD